MEKYLIQTNNDEIKFWINHNLKNYLKTNPENVGEIEHIIDFFHSKPSNLRLKKMSYDEAKTQSQKWMKAQIKKGSDINETREDLKEILRFKNGFKLVRLVGENAFKREGFLMGHCVASFFNKSGSRVYSLRDEKNNPHCTIEIVNGANSINQIKGKGNGSIHPKYIGGVLAVLNYFKIPVRRDEMSYLFYDYLTPELYSYIKEHFEGMQTLKIKDEMFLYRFSKLTRK